jgi:DNA-directed RNA polymerase specialized sigma24 family protein
LLSVSENTIKTRYYRALKELKKLYLNQELWKENYGKVKTKF